jgi:hypothetical protein
MRWGSKGDSSAQQEFWVHLNGYLKTNTMYI